ncbi:MAG: hypothetical protein WDM94_06875 [Bauldia sp.]
MIGKYSKYTNIPLLQRSFKIDLSKLNGYAISGFISMGDYGTESEIINTVTGSASYKKKKNETDPTPFYFQLHLPSKEDRGILCMQKWGLSGVKSLFQDVISSVFQANYPNLRLHIRPLTVSDALQHYIGKGLVQEIIVEKSEIPSDIADKFMGQRKAFEGVFSYSIKPKSRSVLKRPGLIAFAKGTEKLENVYDFGDTGFDTVKVVVEINGNAKTLNLTKPDTISSTFDLTEEVALGPNGYPLESSLASQFSSIVGDLAKRGGISL